MLSLLRGRCCPLALQFCKVTAPVCRLSSCAAISSRFYTERPQTSTPPCVLQLSASNLSGRLGLHTSSQHAKRRKDTEEDYSALLKSYRQELKKAPKSTVYLSLVGLVPLVAVPLAMDFTQCYHPELAFIQLACANCLLCFFGGIRWGFVVQESSPAKLNFVLGAVLPYMSFMSLVLWENIGVSAMTLIGGLIVLAFGGIGMVSPYPFWLNFLKGVFCVVAFLSIISTLWMSSFYPEKKLKKET